MLNAMPRNTV